MRRVCVDAGAAATALTFADEAQRLLTQADAARGEARQALSTAFVNTVQVPLEARIRAKRSKCYSRIPEVRKLVWQSRKFAVIFWQVTHRVCTRNAWALHPNP